MGVAHNKMEWQPGEYAQLTEVKKLSMNQILLCNTAKGCINRYPSQNQIFSFQQPCIYCTLEFSQKMNNHIVSSSISEIKHESRQEAKKITSTQLISWS